MHKLEYVWRLYTSKNKIKPTQEPTLQDWENTLDYISTIATIEDFWGVFNHLKRPSELHGRGAYYLFRQEILPEWEHPCNEGGGEWRLNFTSADSVNDLWLAALLALVGHQLGPAMPHICGVVMNVKGNKHRLTVWIDSDEKALEIGQALKGVLSGHELVYKKHHSEDVLHTL